MNNGKSNNIVNEAFDLRAENVRLKAQLATTERELADLWSAVDGFLERPAVQRARAELDPFFERPGVVKGLAGLVEMEEAECNHS